MICPRCNKNTAFILISKTGIEKCSNCGYQTEELKCVTCKFSKGSKPCSKYYDCFFFSDLPMYKAHPLLNIKPLDQFKELTDFFER